MDATQILTYLGIIGGVIALIKIGFDIYNRYLKDQKEDGDKINDTEKSDLILDGRIKSLEEADKRHEKEFERIRTQELTKMQSATETNTKNIGDLTRLVDRLSTIVEIKVLGEKPKTTLETHEIKTTQVG